MSLADQYVVHPPTDNSPLHPVADPHSINSSILSLLGSFPTMLSSTLISSFSSNLRIVDALSSLPVEFVSSILTVLGTVVMLDRVCDAIGGVIGPTSSFNSGVCAVFCCLVPSRLRDEIGGSIGVSCPTNSGVCTVFCCLCGGLSSLFFPHEER